MNSEITEIINKHQAQYLPEGSIELLSIDHKQSEEYLNLGLILPFSKFLLIKKKEKQILLVKLSEYYFLEILSGLEAYNLGILKSAASKLLTKIKSFSEFTK